MATQKPSIPAQQSSGSEPQITYGAGGLPEPSVPDADSEELTTYFRMRNRYVLMQGTLGAPICAVPGSQTEGMAFASVHIPVAALSVEWQSWRKGARSELPRPYLQDGNTILLKNEIDLDNVEVEGDDNSYFISAGTILYAFKDRSKMTLAYPIPSYIELPPQVNIVNDSDFVPAILNANWPNNQANNAITKVSQ